jgi:futalosine hydrolase
MDKGSILVSAAVEGEVDGIRRNLADTVVHAVGEQEVTSGRLGQQAVRLVVTGPGIANTVHGLTVAMMSEKPKLIIQTGCGGGFEQAGIEIGDVAIASEEIDAQLGLEQDKAGSAVGRLPFPVIRKPGKEIFNCYPVDIEEFNSAVKSLKTGLAGSDATVVTGPFITVATVTGSFGRAGDLHRRYGAIVENMEGSGAAHVAALYDIPFLEIRAVSNKVGARDKRKWDLPLSFERCSQAVMLYLMNS